MTKFLTMLMILAVILSGVLMVAQVAMKAGPGV